MEPTALYNDGRLYLEDLYIGRTFAAGAHRLDEPQVKAFAHQFDPQPFHLDAEAAKATFFKGLVASGWHTAAITIRLLVEDGLPLAGGIIGLGGSIKWLRPSQPGDVLTVQGKITEVTRPQSKRNRGTVTIRAETRNQRGDVVQILTATLSVPSRLPSDQAIE